MTQASQPLRARFPAFATLIKLLLALQALSSLSVCLRLVRTRASRPLDQQPANRPRCETVATLLPVLNEADRIDECLQALVGARGIDEIIVIDGGSRDATETRARAFAEQHHTVQVIQAGASPGEWNGKVWGLHHGLSAASATTDWILTIDADVTITDGLVDALLDRATADRAALVSVATEQHVDGRLLSMLHPAMLTTLVYRFGIPGHVTRNVREVQANGQCFLCRRDALVACGGFAEVRTSICEDVTLARRFTQFGYPVGFYEGGQLVWTEMYKSTRAAWSGWARSLPTRDRYFGVWGWLRLAEVVCAQALIIPALTVVATNQRLRATGWRYVPLGALLLRLGTLAGTRRAYRSCSRTYWLSPLLDLPVTVQIVRCALSSTFVWRGGALIRGE